MKRDNTDKDFTFSELEKSIMHLLRQKRSREVARKLCFTFHPIWHYYINFYLYKNGIYDNNSEKDNMYNEVFVKCVELLDKVKYDVNTDFNRIKRFYNVSIGGWIFNLRAAARKSQITHVSDPQVLYNIISDDAAGERVEYTYDMKIVARHIKSQRGIFKELSKLIYDKYKAYEMFKAAVFERYLLDGRLLSAEDYFQKRVGSMLGEFEDAPVSAAV